MITRRGQVGGALSDLHEALCGIVSNRSVRTEAFKLASALKNLRQKHHDLRAFKRLVGRASEVEIWSGVAWSRAATTIVGTLRLAHSRCSVISDQSVGT